MADQFTAEQAVPQFEHHFRQHVKRDAERRTLIVVVITACCMIAEIAAGIWSGSMALLGDGIHMGTHVLAIGISTLAYIIGRRYAFDRRFSFGTGKFNALAAFASAILLAAAAVLVVAEAIERFYSPSPIAFREALVVAIIGLVVNLVSAWLLHESHEHDDHGHRHHAKAGAVVPTAIDPKTHDHHDPGKHHHHHGHSKHEHAHHHEAHTHRHDQGHAHEDIGLRAAFLHVLADATTSVAAIAALIIGWQLGLLWLDPVVALVASGVIMAWALGLVKESGKVLVDWEAPAEIREQITRAIESDHQSRVVDLHVWSVGAGVRTMVASVTSPVPRRTEEYLARLPADLGIEHPIIEVRLQR